MSGPNKDMNHNVDFDIEQIKETKSFFEKKKDIKIE